jgi:alkylation response protein AidB-like acyl-CoA dehydrogenase
MSDSFRQEVRAWLDANCPPTMRRGGFDPTEAFLGGARTEEHDLWVQRMFENGWTVPTWPKAYGGAGLNKDENVILQDELRRIGARPAVTGMGVTMIGPALLEFGTEEQKLEHLPKIASGEIAWCQGYSEPNAGSDLASLRTSAIEDGDEYVINGQKIWTSGADRADWIFCLVRTDPNAPKHEGITFILFTMHQPGVTVRPIRLISGMSPFCETFFDNARALKKNVVGEVNKGWTVAKRLLQYERTSIAGIGGGAGGGGSSLENVAKQYAGEVDGRIANAMLRDQIITHRMNDRAFGLTTRRSLEESKTGLAPGATSSMFKYYGTEQNKRRYELLLAAMGTQAVGWDGNGFTDQEIATTRAWLRSKANSIEGGTSEVQLNIIAKRVLELPDEPAANLGK